MLKNSFIVTGMSCASCAANVQNAVQKLDGVVLAKVNLATACAIPNKSVAIVHM